MHISIGCMELGIDCDFVITGESGESIIESIMRHVRMEHTEDWYEVEEIYQVAWSLVRGKAA